MTSDSGHLYIHIGPPKTGTSAIQHILKAHDNSAVVYPKVGLWWDGSHHDLAYNFFPDISHPKSKKADIKSLFAAIAAEATDPRRNILISSEVLWGLDVGSFIRALQPYLGPRPVEILATCREHFSLATSMYAHCVRDPQFREKGLPADYIARVAPWLTYSRVLQSLVGEGFAVRVVNYHPVESFVRRFLGSVGYPTDRLEEIESRNASLSVKGMIVGLCINRLAANDQERADAFEAAGGMADFYGPASGIFDGPSRAVLRAILLKDAAYLEEAFALRLPIRDAAGQDSFFLNGQDFDDIAAAIAPLGGLGRRIAQEARGFCRPR